jgi:hypothetical protein
MFANVEVTAGQGAFAGDPLADLPLSIAFNQIATITLANIAVAVD